MIRTKEDLLHYISEDAKQAGEPIRYSLKQRLVCSFIHNYNREFMICLRHLEYHKNNEGVFHKLMALWYSRKHAELRARTGIELNENVAGPGFHPSHGKIVISSIAKIGKNCKILSDVTIGGQGRYDVHGAPILGDRVFIASGAKIIGNITIADGVVIGANAVVTKDITEPNTTWAGSPAHKISDNGSFHFLTRTGCRNPESLLLQHHQQHT